MRRIALLPLLGLALAACGDGERAGTATAATRAPVATPDFAQVTSQVPSRPAGRYLTARVKRAVWMRSTPDGRKLEKLGRNTEFGSKHVLSVVGRRDGWLRVISAQLSNRRRGWIPAAAARLGGTDYEILIDRSARKATLRLDGRAVRSFPVAVGRPGNETPLGRFAVTDKLRPNDPTSPYGCCAVALSGHQTKLVPGWPGGDRLAIHGTPQPETIGRPISLGCMRAHRRDLGVLMRRVPLGTPVFIRA